MQKASSSYVGSIHLSIKVDSTVFSFWFLGLSCSFEVLLDAAQMKGPSPCFLPRQGPGRFGCEALAVIVELGTHSVYFMNVTVMNWNIQGMVSFQSSSGRPWQFCQKKKRIPLNSPIMQILNVTYDPPDVWCPMKEAVTSNQMAGSKGQQGEATSGALSGWKSGRQFLWLSWSCCVLIIWRFATNNKGLEIIRC